VVWCGVVGWGAVRWGVVWCGAVRWGVVWCGAVWCGVVRCGVVQCGVVWCGVIGDRLIGPYIFPQRLTGDISTNLLQGELPKFLENVPLQTRRQLC